jgi:hypothetical protein
VEETAKTGEAMAATAAEHGAQVVETAAATEAKLVEIGEAGTAAVATAGTSMLSGFAMKALAITAILSSIHEVMEGVGTLMNQYSAITKMGANWGDIGAALNPFNSQADVQRRMQRERDESRKKQGEGGEPKEGGGEPKEGAEKKGDEAQDHSIDARVQAAQVLNEETFKTLEGYDGQLKKLADIKKIQDAITEAEKIRTSGGAGDDEDKKVLDRLNLTKQRLAYETMMANPLQAQGRAIADQIAKAQATRPRLTILALTTREIESPAGSAFQIVLSAVCISPNTPEAVTINVTPPIRAASPPDIFAEAPLIACCNRSALSAALSAHQTPEPLGNSSFRRRLPEYQAGDRDDYDQDRSEGRRAVERDRRRATQRLILDERGHRLRQEIERSPQHGRLCFRLSGETDPFRRPLLRQFLGDDLEHRQPMWTKGRDHRDVCGVSAARNEDPADAGLVVTGVERIPAAAQVSFEPCIEVHGSGIWRDADVAEITVAEPRRNVHATTQCDREVRKVSANAAPLFHRLRGRARFAGFGIAESQATMDKIADGLHPGPSARDAAELRPSEIGQQVVLAISARHQEG